MDYEEKYKQALEGIEEILSSGQDSIKMSRLKLRLQGIFPELAESEDERIRKELIIYLDWLDGRNKDYQPKGQYAIRDMLAWLEKQGQEPMKVSIWKHWKDGICGNGDGKLIYLIKNGDDYSLSSVLGYECDYIELSELDNLLEKQGEQKPPIEMKSAEESLGISSDEYNKIVDECVYGEQKPAEWSEEDGKNLEQCIYVCHQHGYEGCVNWLKSLKQRIFKGEE